MAVNKRPVYFSQHDKRWGDKPYQVPGENDTIGKSGCGPSCAAMLITTLTGKKFTPEDACRWSIEHGYKALNQGTYYGYFTPQFKAFGIDCKMLPWSNSYHKPNHPNHKKAMDLLKQGYYIIALMGPGNWTTGGHFVVVWWQDGKIRINDPNSTRENRTNGNINTFRNEVKYYWAVDARGHNAPKEDDEDMTQDKFKELFDEMRSDIQNNPGSGWSEEARNWAISSGLVSGNNSGEYLWQDFLTREQMAMLLFKFARMMGKA